MIDREAIVGCLLGTAVGDALGLPYEGLSRRRAAGLFGPPDRHRLLTGRGMVSDDTEHACLTAQALIAAGVDLDALTRQLASRLRLWLLSVPAGVGFATLRATLKLCAGVSPQRSGVYSAGNGPAMRSVVLGPAIDDPPLLWSMVRACTRITHTDPKAAYGALAVALAARMQSERAGADPGRFATRLAEMLMDEPAAELIGLIDQIRQSLARNESTEQFAASLGLDRGVSGYVYHTVPVVLHAWLRHPADYRNALIEVIRCGGDTDTTGAILGGIIGSGVGKDGIPAEWLRGLCEWPRTVDWMERLATQLANVRNSRTTARPLRLPVYGVLPRNLAFLAVVLAHGFRRLFPPY